MQANLQLTITSIGSMIAFSMLFAIFLAYALRNDKLLGRVKYELLLVCMMAPVMKIWIPMEVLPWSININIPHVLPKVVIFFNRIVLTHGSKPITLWGLILGVLFILSVLNVLKTVLDYRTFLLEKERAPKIEDATIHKLIDKILEEKGRKVDVSLRRAQEKVTPSVYGIFKPTILLPQRPMSEVELECVLRHELAHYLHGDLLIRFGWILIKAFCFWNPAVYILDKQFERILEIRADENVLKGKDIVFQKHYMETIVKLSVKDQEEDIPFSAAFYKSNGLNTKRRLEIISQRMKRKIVEFVLVNLLTSITVIALAWAMNCLIFEPKGEVPDVSDVGSVSRVEDVTTNNSFFIKNPDGTYDMYMDGVYRTTLDSTLGSAIMVYESIEEALKYEEIK